MSCWTKGIQTIEFFTSKMRSSLRVNVCEGLAYHRKGLMKEEQAQRANLPSRRTTEDPLGSLGLA